MKICVSLYQLWIIEVTYLINKEYIFNVFGGLSYIDILMTVGFLYILWNSWESMFVGNQNFPILWGRNFVGSQFVIIFINIKRLWWCKVVGKGYLWMPRTLTSTNNDDSTVIHFTHESKLFLVTIFDISFL